MAEIDAEYFNFRDAWSSVALRHPDLSPAEKIVLLALIMYRNRTSGVAWPSSRSLADDCDVSLQTARRALQKGEKFGLLFTVRQGTGGEGADNRASVRRFIIPKESAAETLPTGEQGTPNAGTRSDQGGQTLPSTGYPPYSHVSDPLPSGEYLTHEGTHDLQPMNNNHSSTRVEGDGGQHDDSPKDYDYFLDYLEPIKSHSFTEFCDNNSLDYGEMLDIFEDYCGEEVIEEPGARQKWIKKFLGVCKAEINMRAA